MERIPRAEGEVYTEPLIPQESKKARYDVDVRYEIPPHAALATQYLLMTHMLPHRLKPMGGTLSEDTRADILERWVLRYADFFGPMCSALSLTPQHPDLIEAIKAQDIHEALQGNSTLSEDELQSMASYLEESAVKAKKEPLFTEEELDAVVTAYLH